LRCKNRLFSVTNKRFLQIFLNILFYSLIYNNIHLTLKNERNGIAVPFISLAKRFYFSVKSTISASGAFFCTEAMPFFMLVSLAYIWLEPIIWPLVAVKLK